MGNKNISSDILPILPEKNLRHILMMLIASFSLPRRCATSCLLVFILFVTAVHGGACGYCNTWMGTETGYCDAACARKAGKGSQTYEATTSSDYDHNKSY